eukprot:SAG11_NODE_11956_length_729_cov_1.509524_1_plen_30_part_01
MGLHGMQPYVEYVRRYSCTAVYIIANFKII